LIDGRELQNQQPDSLQALSFSIGVELSDVGWHASFDDTNYWAEYSPPKQIGRDAGTKLHVSSSVRCAADVLAACVPLFRARGVAFKHVANLELLAHLSTGQGGRSQIGKFLTVYPADEAVAMVIAEELDAATVGYSGPRIPNERPFREGSLIYSRFGSFRRHWIQLPSGRIVPAVMTADGLDIDDRTQTYTKAVPNRSRVLREKYVRVSRMFESPKGRTDLGFLDSDAGGDFVVIKEAFAHTMEDVAGRDAISRLRNEAACLATIACTRISPEFVDYWDDEHSSFLIYRPIQGPTLGSIIAALASEGLRPPPNLLRQWMNSLCDVVAELHKRGYVSCDIKPSNIVVTDDGLKLIDFELSGPPTDEPTGSMGTPGFCSPEQADPAAGRSVLNDVFGIGATLLSAATASDASNLGNAQLVAKLEHKRAQENPIFAVAARCLDNNTNLRFQSVQGILEGAADPYPAEPVDVVSSVPLAMAGEIADRILAAAKVVDDTKLFWTSEHHTVNGQPGRDLYAGASGTALYLCSLARMTRNEEYLAAAAKCGTWLWETEPMVPRRQSMPGLYFGDSGPTLLYLALHIATQDEVWLDRSNEMAARLDKLTVHSPDLMTGLAGIGLLHLMRWHVDGFDSSLDAAHRCASRLLERREHDRLIWRMPDNFDLLSRKEYLGFSHGSAGIGYFLAQYSLFSGDEPSQKICHDIADWLIELAQPALEDRSGLYWKASETSDRSSGTNWCHGAPGMARFLLSAYSATKDDSHLEAAVSAGRMTALGGSWIGTSQCHGLAGNIEVLIDVAQQAGRAEFRSWAAVLTENLVAYREKDGWPSDERSKKCPDLMVGEAGVGAAFLRVSDPTSAHLVSCDAFRA
jgi:hypothetical protein